MKKILILGASVYQVPLILAAKRMGLYTIVASIPGEYPGFALADKVYDINTVDKEAILQVALDEKIDGICTTGTDGGRNDWLRVRAHGAGRGVRICSSEGDR